MDIKEKTIALIDDLKATCQKYGLGNDGNEYKIIIQIFLYKFINDKFGYEIKQNEFFGPKITKAPTWEEGYKNLEPNEQGLLLNLLGAKVPKLKPEHLLSYLRSQENIENFHELLDKTMLEIAEINSDTFSTKTTKNTRVELFEPITEHVIDKTSRDNFAKALVDKLANFSFESAFAANYDFFASIFEYLIQDYNTAGGGKYAEYYTPHAIASIMANLLVEDENKLTSVECYDPSAGTGTLLMALAHRIGEERCTIYSQDISQRSNKMLKLNLMLNGLISSLDNIIQGDTLTEPYHMSDDGKNNRQFDFVVSNPPFKMDFSDTRESIASASNSTRFWAGVPKVPNKKKESMAIYTCFLQHVINSMKPNGKAAIVVPTGFITAKSNIEGKILKRLVEDKIVYGCVSMPSNVFANTGTNVSVLFLDKSAQNDKVVLIDASNLGEEYKDPNGLKKRRLNADDIEKIVKTFHAKEKVDEFSAVVSYEEIAAKNNSLSAGQYFDIKIEHEDITQEEFEARMSAFKTKLAEQFEQSQKLQQEIMAQLDSLKLNSK